jgi:monofunctional biosynthetic peptidoglycan transglycosylase
MKNIDFERIKQTILGLDYNKVADRSLRYTKKTIKWALISLCIFFIGSFVILFSLKWINPSFTSFTLQEDWEELGKERYSLSEEWVNYNDIPQNIKWAVVASEDQKYWNHPGIDLVAIAEAYQEMENGERVRGASTITQQVAKNLFLSSDKNFFRKGIEAGLAVTIDALWGKERVLEIYLNVAEFGPGIYGIGKASDHFFGKEARSLKDDESARMAAVLPNPKRMRVEPASPYVKERKDWILRNMMNLSGIAYYEPPKPTFVSDSLANDSVSTIDLPFIDKVDISKVRFTMDGYRYENEIESDSSVTDTTSNNFDQ